MKDLALLIKENLKITLTDRQVSQFEIYAKFLIEFNSHTNLTRVAENDIDQLHFYDSLAVLKFVEFTKVKNLLDVGTGAGFPGVPLKILFPHLKLALLDSRKKKITFLEELCEKLSLTDISAIHGRAEDIAKENRFKSSFDLVTARAVAETKLLVKILYPFKNLEGKIALYKGPKALAELSDAENELKKYNLRSEVKTFNLPVSGESRNIIILS